MAEVTSRVLGERRVTVLHNLASQPMSENAVEACKITAKVIRECQTPDIPFACLYLLDSTGQTAQLIDSVGLTKGSKMCPEQVNLEEFKSNNGL